MKTTLPFYNVGFKISHEIFTIKDYSKELRLIQQEADYDTLFDEAKEQLFENDLDFVFLEDIERSSERLCKDLKISTSNTFPTLNKGLHHSKMSRIRNSLIKKILNK